MVKPLAPSEVTAAQVELFPDFVIETWNTVIAKNWSGTQSRILQDDIMLELDETEKDRKLIKTSQMTLRVPKIKILKYGISQIS